MGNPCVELMNDKEPICAEALNGEDFELLEEGYYGRMVGPYENQRSQTLRQFDGGHWQFSGRYISGFVKTMGQLRCVLNADSRE